MSEVHAGDLTKINNVDDVFALYAGASDQAKVGIEVEISFINALDPDLSVMNLRQNGMLKKNAHNALPHEDWVHHEPTSEVLEVASMAASFQQGKDVLNDTNRKIKILTDQAQALGLKRSYFQELPDKTADELLSRIVDVERYHIMYDPYRADMKKCVQYFAVCKSNQVSVSPHNMDHMLENVRRLYILAPFLFLLTDNSAGFNEGKAFSNHIGMSWRHAGLSGGLGVMPRYVFTVQSGAEFIKHHINHVMNHPLFMYYDMQGNLVRVPSGNWTVTFERLKQQDLNISSNYYLAQSLLWPDVKIAALKDKTGHITGHRYEARMFGVGLHQHQSAFLIVSSLAFHPDFAGHVDALLARYGFAQDQGLSCYDTVQKSYKAAREHGGQFFDIAYGTGIMSEFAQSFADLMEDIADEINMTEEIQPLLHICRTGWTDGKVNRALCPTLDDVIQFQRTYDAQIFENPNMCAHMLFEKDIMK